MTCETRHPTALRVRLPTGTTDDRHVAVQQQPIFRNFPFLKLLIFTVQLFFNPVENVKKISK